MVGHLPTVTLQLLYTRPRQHVAAGRETRASRVLSQITFVLLCFIFYWFELVGMWFHCCFVSHRDSFCDRRLIQNVFISVCCLLDYCYLFLLLFFLSGFLHFIVFSSFALCLPLHPLLSVSSNNYFLFFAHSLPQRLPLLHFILLSPPTWSSFFFSSFFLLFLLLALFPYLHLPHPLPFSPPILYTLLYITSSSSPTSYIFTFSSSFSPIFFHSSVSRHFLPLLLPPHFSSISSSSDTISSSLSSQPLLLSLCPSVPDLALHLLCFSCSSFLSASFSNPSSSFSSFYLLTHFLYFHLFPRLLLPFFLLIILIVFLSCILFSLLLLLLLLLPVLVYCYFLHLCFPFLHLPLLTFFLSPPPLVDIGDEGQRSEKMSRGAMAEHQFSDADDSEGGEEEGDEVDDEDDEEDDYDGDSTPKTRSRSTSPQPYGLPSMSITAVASSHPAPHLSHHSASDLLGSTNKPPLFGYFTTVPSIQITPQAPPSDPAGRERSQAEYQRGLQRALGSRLLAPPCSSSSMDEDLPVPSPDLSSPSSRLSSPGLEHSGCPSPISPSSSPSAHRYLSPRHDLSPHPGHLSPRRDISPLRHISPKRDLGVAGGYRRDLSPRRGHLSLLSPLSRPTSPAGRDYKRDLSPRGRHRGMMRPVSPRRGLHQHLHHQR